MEIRRAIQFLALALIVSMAACGRDDSPETPLELAARAGAPLFDGMGDHHHPITTADPAAQRYFDQGLIID
ncbi:MAG: hypothetical protein OEY72_06090, partial [Gammaproteobacteria bacterium]|nr:hypothetical protein [Gammaproteobacteria bacterium]